MAFIRAGYPHGVPQTDCIPLLALLRRRLSDDEVAAVARELAVRGEWNIDIADTATISVSYSTWQVLDDQEPCKRDVHHAAPSAVILGDVDPHGDLLPTPPGDQPRASDVARTISEL